MSSDDIYRHEDDNVYRHEDDNVAPAFMFKTVRESLQALVVAAEQAPAAGD